MANEEVIRQQMDETRASLTDKLETLEDKVTGTVENATQAVNETVDAVKESVQETVATVKESVEGSATAVKETVEEGMETVKEWFDLPAQVEHRPWLMMAASVCTGYCLERMVTSFAGPAKTVAEESGPPRMHHVGNGGHHKRRHEPARGVRSLFADFGPEIDKLKGLALGALLGTVREMIVQAVPEQPGQQLKEIIDSATRKMGGEPIQGSDLGIGAAESSTQGERHESQRQRFSTEMGRPMGPTHRQG